MASATIFLFGKPGWELPIENEDITDTKLFKDFGTIIMDRMNKISIMTKTLLTSGWKCKGSTYDLKFHKEISKEKAEEEFNLLGFAEYFYIQEK